VPATQVRAITSWYQEDANAVVVAPLPKLGAKVALTAWTDWTECTGFKPKAANAFRKAFRYHAPEQFPKSFLEPGQ
jgi:ketosteroid isomerase-like protein